MSFGVLEKSSFEVSIHTQEGFAMKTVLFLCIIETSIRECNGELDGCYHILQYLERLRLYLFHLEFLLHRLEYSLYLPSLEIEVTGVDIFIIFSQDCSI